MNSHELFELVDGAKAVRYDQSAALLLVWKGGHGIHAYDPWGQEVSYWMIESEGQDATEEEIIGSMQSHMEEAYYPA